MNNPNPKSPTKSPVKKKRKFNPVSMSMKYSGVSEKKYLDTTKGNTTVTSPGVILSNTLVGMVEGTGESQRVGRRVFVKGIFIKGRITLPVTSDPTLTSDQARFIVYQDRQCNAAAAAVTDILQTASIYSFRNLDNSKRFKILYDHTFDLNSQSTKNITTVEFGECVVGLNINIPINASVSYNSTNGGTIADITENNFGIMAISSSGQVNTQYVARVRYSDK